METNYTYFNEDPLPGMPEPPEAVIDNTRATLEKQLADVRVTNHAKYKSLVQQGFTPTAEAILMARLETLLELLLNEDGRLGFDLAFERRMTDILNDTLAAARQQALLGNGGPPSGGLIVPG